MEHFGLESLDDLPGVDELEAVGLLEDADQPTEGSGLAPARLPLDETGDGAEETEELGEGEASDGDATTVVTLSGRGGAS